MRTSITFRHFVLAGCLAASAFGAACSSSHGAGSGGTPPSDGGNVADVASGTDGGTNPADASDDRASGDASDSSASSLWPECATLSACCATLTGSNKTQCEQDLATTAPNEANCAMALQNLQDIPVCLGSAFDDRGPCGTLAQCCATLTGSNKTECDQDLATTKPNEANCAMALVGIQDIPACVGPGFLDSGTCGTLGSCCSMLEGSPQTMCNQDLTMAGGNNESCAAALQAIQDSNMCLHP